MAAFTAGASGHNFLEGLITVEAEQSLIVIATMHISGNGREQNCSCTFSLEVGGAIVETRTVGWIDGSHHFSISKNLRLKKDIGVRAFEVRNEHATAEKVEILVKNASRLPDDLILL